MVQAFCTFSGIQVRQVDASRHPPSSSSFYLAGIGDELFERLKYIYFQRDTNVLELLFYR
jgi:hypothetical protein